MSSKNRYYSMNKEQFGQLCDFYRTLGYNDEQVKLLSENCFGYDVRVEENAEYKPDWSFELKFDRVYARSDDMAMMGSGAFMGGAAMTGGIPGGMMMGMASAMSAPAMASAAPMGMQSMMMMSSVPVPSPVPQAEFSSAEAKEVRENEPQSPMDAPQAIFSANVNTGSWSYMRNMICLHRAIDRSFVRIEEILNSYPYKLDPPVNGDLFSIKTEYSSCPWNKDEDLLLVEMKAKEADASVKQNLVLLIDVSGSMDDKWVLVQMSAAAIMSNLKDGDTLSIIAYSNETRTVVKQIGCGDRDKCVDALMQVDGIGGGTNGSEGLTNAYSYLSETYDKEANNRIFIFTDGDFNFGITSEGGLSGFIRDKRETGIYLSVVGYGMQNIKDNKMEAIAQNGNGNYTFVSNPADILDNLNDKLISNLITVAKDVKISVEFNPAYVSEYRLIGYDARQLTQKEFNDTEKAADGIGSGHNVVALIAVKRGEAKQRYSTRYVTSEAGGCKDEFAFIEVHYKAPDGTDLVYTKAVTVADIENSEKTNIPVASMLAAFGLLIKKSDYMGSASLDMLAAMIADFDKDGCVSAEDPYGHFAIIRKFLFRR